MLAAKFWDSTNKSTRTQKFGLGVAPRLLVRVPVLKIDLVFLCTTSLLRFNWLPTVHEVSLRLALMTRRTGSEGGVMDVDGTDTYASSYSIGWGLQYMDQCIM